MPMLADLVDHVIGVDTHKHTHTMAVVDARTGAALADLTAATDPDGYASFLTLARHTTGRRCWAIEGAGGYGAGLSAFLRAHDEWVVEIDRPNRSTRRHGARSDQLDAVRAAREALARPVLAAPKQGEARAALADLLAVRRSAVDAATEAQQQLHALVVTAPEPLRARFRGQSTIRVVQTAANLRIAPDWDLHTRTAAQMLHTLARRAQRLSAEAAEHARALDTIVRAWRPDLLELCGVGPIVAATILTSWSHPGRFTSEAAFAMTTGAAPIPASSGQTTRHRLNRSGDRQLNRALHTIALTRLRHDPATQAYAQRRRAEAKTDRDIKRCLKRYIARQLYRQLENALVNP